MKTLTLLLGSLSLSTIEFSTLLMILGILFFICGNSSNVYTNQTLSQLYYYKYLTFSWLIAWNFICQIFPNCSISSIYLLMLILSALNTPKNFL